MAMSQVFKPTNASCMTLNSFIVTFADVNEGRPPLQSEEVLPSGYSTMEGQQISPALLPEEVNTGRLDNTSTRTPGLQYAEVILASCMDETSKPKRRYTIEGPPALPPKEANPNTNCSMIGIDENLQPKYRNTTEGQHISPALLPEEVNTGILDNTSTRTPGLQYAEVILPSCMDETLQSKRRYMTEGHLSPPALLPKEANPSTNSSMIGIDEKLQPKRRYTTEGHSPPALPPKEANPSTNSSMIGIDEKLQPKRRYTTEGHSPPALPPKEANPSTNSSMIGTDENLQPKHRNKTNIEQKSDLPVKATKSRRLGNANIKIAEKQRRKTPMSMQQARQSQSHRNSASGGSGRKECPSILEVEEDERRIDNVIQ